MPRGKQPDWALVANYVPRQPWKHRPSTAVAADEGTTDGGRQFESAGGQERSATAAPVPQPPPSKGPTMPKVTPEQAARAKLRNFGVPLPQDFIPDLGPACGALFLRECSEATLASVNVNLAAEQGTEGEDDGSAAELLNALTTCLASATIACVRLGLLPKEAEEAMEQAMTVEPVP